MKTFQIIPESVLKIMKNRRLAKHQPRLWRIPGLDLGYLKMTKVASTSIELCLATYIHCTVHNGRADEVDEQLVKHYEKRYTELIDIRELAEEKLPGYLFSFVRNPLDRLYSCYVDKILGVRQAGENKCLFWSHGITLDMSFEQFLRRVAEIPDSHIDRHLRSQYYFLWKGERLLPNHVGRFENIANDWQYLVDTYGLPALPHENRTDKPSEESPYTRETAMIAAERYRKDIELFGYGDDVRRLIESL